MRQSTHERHEELIELHIKPALGRIRLKDLKSAHMRFFYRERLDSGLAPATVHKIHAVLHKALKAAVSDGLVPRNAACRPQAAEDRHARRSILWDRRRPAGSSSRLQGPPTG